VDTSTDFCSGRHFEFSKWPPLKTEFCYNFGLHVIICMKFGVWIAFYIENHKICEDISPDSCESRHFEFSKWPPLKVLNCYNFGLCDVTIWMKFGIWIACYVKIK